MNITKKALLICLLTASVSMEVQAINPLNFFKVSKTNLTIGTGATSSMLVSIAAGLRFMPKGKWSISKCMKSAFDVSPESLKTTAQFTLLSAAFAATNLRLSGKDITTSGIAGVMVPAVYNGTWKYSIGQGVIRLAERISGNPLVDKLLTFVHPDNFKIAFKKWVA